MAYVRKTRDEYVVEGYFGRRIGWECIGKADTYEDMKEMRKDYQQNKYYTCRIKRKMVKVA